MPPYLFFYIGLAFIIMHEMDAVRCKEWRIFPGLYLLNDILGYKIFMLVHVPLFFFLFYFLNRNELNKELIYGLDIFFIIHFALHLLFLRHRKNEFKDWISWSIISCAALSGLVDLLLA